jgi:hypothetical protein
MEEGLVDSPPRRPARLLAGRPVMDWWMMRSSQQVIEEGLPESLPPDEGHEACHHLRLKVRAGVDADRVVLASDHP